MYTFSVALMTLLVKLAASQQIFDVLIYRPQHDQNHLFSAVGPGVASPINFETSGTSASADIVIDENTVYQSIAGYGASLTDASASVLNGLKTANKDKYGELLNKLFDVSDTNGNAGLTYLRVPLGATDFSANVWSFDETDGDTALDHFDVNNAPAELFSVIQDILSVNPDIKIHILPWSPPGWMKDTGTMKGGVLKDEYQDVFANYLLKCLQAFKDKGITAYAISIQNEPENNNDSLPSTVYTAAKEAAVGKALRSLMDKNGFNNVKLIGYEHNWDHAAEYPVHLLDAAPDAFAGVSFHCYRGTVDQMEEFYEKYKDKEIYTEECTGTSDTDWWADVKWTTQILFVDALKHHAMASLYWNLALDENGGPQLDGASSCDHEGGCTGLVEVKSNGTYVLRRQYYALAQLSRAILPKDAGGPFGKRIGVSVTGDQSWALVVGAFLTERGVANEPSRYSLVVLNCESATTSSATISFKGKQAKYTFPVGVSTLFW
uniref:Glycoside hydrolase family 30 protein n=1 Tax=Schizophyllum commune (strain H4-8 / FGSC 9210) TaxID=578458 RepID=D8Q9M6_SCHCM